MGEGEGRGVRRGASVCAREKTLGQVGFQSTESGAGEQFLLKDRKAKVE